MSKKKGQFKIFRFDSLSSTNDYAKTLTENSFVIAKKQTGGRGTKGRSFSSNEGGVYLTKVSFDKKPTDKAFLIMASAAVAVCKVLESYGVQPKIKWANDVYVHDKKICGILIENRLSGRFLSSSIVGVGLNVSNSLEEELSPIATTLCSVLGKKISVNEVADKLMEFLLEEYPIEEYVKRVGYLDREILLIEGEKQTKVYALKVDLDGSLLVKDGETVRAVRAAEVSVRV